MRKSRFTQEQIIGILREYKVGRPATGPCCQGVHPEPAGTARNQRSPGASPKDPPEPRARNGDPRHSRTPSASALPPPSVVVPKLGQYRGKTEVSGDLLLLRVAYVRVKWIGTRLELLSNTPYS
jgi:hypothetical protein